MWDGDGKDIGKGSGTGKQMNNVSFATEMKTERRPQQMVCVRGR